MLFKWKDSYSFTIEEIDKQHKRLFEIGADLFDIASLKDDYDHYDEIIKLLDELKEYTVYHFGYEEKLMEKYGYSEFDIHKIEHDFFIKKLARLEKLNLDEKQNEAIVDMIRFVADWVSAHILKTDFQYKDFFKEKGLV